MRGTCSLLFKAVLCETCGRAFRNSNLLRLHRKRTCAPTVIVLYECDICNKHLRSKQALTEHRNGHTGRSPFVCVVRCVREEADSVSIELLLFLELRICVYLASYFANSSQAVRGTDCEHEVGSGGSLSGNVVGSHSLARFHDRLV